MCIYSHIPTLAFRLMVLDEIDQLDTKTQEVLYTLFEWPSLNKSRLVLVGLCIPNGRVLSYYKYNDCSFKILKL